MILMIWTCILGVWGAALIGFRHLIHNRHDRAEKRHQDQFNLVYKAIQNPWSEGTA